MAASSFQKKKARSSNIPSIRGTKPSLHNAQLLTSTGVQSFDYILGGGFAVGTVLLIEEDRFGHYAKVLLKYFIAEGIVCNHSVLVAGGDIKPSAILQEIPALRENSQSSNVPIEEPMKIAWRYETVPTVKTLCEKSDFGHQFDLGKHMTQETIAKCKVITYDVTLDHSEDATSPVKDHDSYGSLLRRIREVIDGGAFGTGMDQPHTNLLRIAIHSAGSPLWSNASDGCEIFRFFYSLRSVLRSAFAVCLVTVPSHLKQDPVFSERLIRFADTSITLESFEGSDKSKNPLFKDYHGLFHVHYQIALNSLLPPAVDTSDLAFKVKRHNFMIEKLHLPPDLSETASRPQEDPDVNKRLPLLMACGGIGNKLDF